VILIHLWACKKERCINPRNDKLKNWEQIPEEPYVSDIFIEGSYAYLALGSELVVLDISQPHQTKQVAALLLSLRSSSLQDLYVADGYAYLAAEKEGLRVVDVPTGHDISEPTVLVEVGSLELPNAQAVVVSGEYAYVIAEGLRVIKVSNPAAPPPRLRWLI
jgi:hypothetical protein